MLSPYRIIPSSSTKYTRKQKTPNAKLDDVKMTSNDLKMTSSNLKMTSKEPVKPRKNKLKVGATIEISDK